MPDAASPVICFGQQPCGIFPRRFLYAKFVTARRLQREIGGEIVFFYHDSDHDPRETATCLRNQRTGCAETLNFQYANRLQKEFSPLFAKHVLPEWREKIARQLPNFVPPELVARFRETRAENAADFCLEMYCRLGLLDGIRVARSGDPALRERACAVEDFFVDVPHAGELVRARWRRDDGRLFLHKGGGQCVELPAQDFGPAQVSPARDTRLRWMQSVVRCTHYVAGAGEKHYLRCEETPEITFVPRDFIAESDRAWVPGDEDNVQPATTAAA
ncbi:MAG: hypothetical protein JO295_14300 [Verrucomicrobia bacterium]|nr:hypothetical protein [Verrucomicrobiota bacterium]